MRARTTSRLALRLSRAEMARADRTRFVLDVETWDAFTAALDRPAEVKPAVSELLRRPRPE
jgi:uncharacterized protein (DUF1778 family)